MRSLIGAEIEKYLGQSGSIPSQSLEFDATEAVLAMVSGGVGWAITSPLCLLHSQVHATSLSVMQLPRPFPSRELFFVGRQRLGESLFNSIFEDSKSLLEQLLVLKIRIWAPWAVDDISFG